MRDTPSCCARTESWIQGLQSAHLWSPIPASDTHRPAGTLSTNRPHSHGPEKMWPSCGPSHLCWSWWLLAPATGPAACPALSLSGRPDCGLRRGCRPTWTAIGDSSLPGLHNGPCCLAGILASHSLQGEGQLWEAWHSAAPTPPHIRKERSPTCRLHYSRPPPLLPPQGLWPGLTVSAF